jgi:Ca2+-binding RTX toxin-like protein
MAAQRGFPRNLRLGVLALSLAFGTGVFIPPPASAGTCNALEATIDLEGQPGPAYIVGTDGPDVIHGTYGDDQILGMGGNDVICGDKGVDTIDGGSGRDTILGDGAPGGGDATNQLMGGPGGDNIQGGHADDTLRGGPGHDHLFGGAGGVDVLYGNDEDSPAPDYLDGGSADPMGTSGDICFANAPDTLVNCP